MLLAAASALTAGHPRAGTLLDHAQQVFDEHFWSDSGAHGCRRLGPALVVPRGLPRGQRQHAQRRGAARRLRRHRLHRLAGPRPQHHRATGPRHGPLTPVAAARALHPGLGAGARLQPRRPRPPVPPLRRHGRAPPGVVAADAPPAHRPRTRGRAVDARRRPEPVRDGRARRLGRRRRRGLRLHDRLLRRARGPDQAALGRRGGHRGRLRPVGRDRRGAVPALVCRVVGLRAAVPHRPRGRVLAARARPPATVRPTRCGRASPTSTTPTRRRCCPRSARSRPLPGPLPDGGPDGGRGKGGAPLRRSPLWFQLSDSRTRVTPQPGGGAGPPAGRSRPRPQLRP